MTVLQTVTVAFGMFSGLPVPKTEWTERNMRYALCAFPLVGLVIGILLWAVSRLLTALSFPLFLRGVLMTLLPVWITGGIHLDGYADTCDALASHAQPEKKREILADPHIGSFAVIRLCCCLLLTAALWSAVQQIRLLPLLGCFCLSRTLSGLSVAVFPLSKDSGLAAAFAAVSDRKRVRSILLVLDILLSLSLCFCGWSGILMILAAHAVFACYARMSKMQFGGLSGDLAGWFLVQAEKWMLIAMFAGEYLEVLF